MTDTLPTEVHSLSNLSATAGALGVSGGEITWMGTVSGSVPVLITYNVILDAGVTDPQVVRNTMLIDDGLGNVYQRQATAIANGYTVHLPVVNKD